ncbi:hypothetical protein TNCV_3064821 [Trichonephila clavipes]|nr:hypothetical protein TNCV_3064821 [Trichonephila clavipes]
MFYKFLHIANNFVEKLQKNFYGGEGQPLKKLLLEKADYSRTSFIQTFIIRPTAAQENQTKIRRYGKWYSEKCLRRCCRRRKFKRKALPDSVKSLRPSDRARLLGESSDEEF